jgi:subtilisin family serine protease
MRFTRRWTYAIACGLTLSIVASAWARHRASVQGAPKTSPQPIETGCADDVPAQESFRAVAAAPALRTATGAGVVVAVLDGGFDLRHEFLKGHLGAQFDALDMDDCAQDLGNGIDDDGDGITDGFVGHGTFVAGLVLAAAPDVTILPIRVLNDEGDGDPASLARGITTAVSLGADVVNLSLTATCVTPQLQTALQLAVDSGVVIVVAAGDFPNGPYDAQFLHDRAINVGAVDASLTVAAFSPCTPSTVDVYAPGVDVVGPLGGAVADSYATWTGTSFSVPLVSAAAALVRQEHPKMGLADMRTRLMAATNAVSGANPSGRGAIDFLEAVTDQ